MLPAGLNVAVHATCPHFVMRRNVRSQLPAAVRSYYQGPAARGYQPVDLEVRGPEEQAPRAASPQRYSNIGSRISSSRPAARPPQPSSTELLSGSLHPDGPLSPRRRRGGPGSARLAPRGRPASLPPPAGEQLRSAPSPRPGAGPEKRAAAPLNSRDKSPGTRREIQAEAAAAAIVASQDMQQAPRRPRPQRDEENAGASPLSGKLSGLSPSARFAATVKALVEKVNGAEKESRRGGGAGRPKTAAVGRTADLGAAAAASVRECAAAVQQIRLPSTPTQMMTSTTGSAAGLVERVLMSEGYMRSNMLKIVDQLPQVGRPECGASGSCERVRAGSGIE